MLCALLVRQLPPLGLLGRPAPSDHSLVGPIARPPGMRRVRLDRALFIHALVGGRPALSGVKVEHCALGIGDALTVERVAFLLARIAPRLPLGPAGPTAGRCKTVEQPSLALVGTPTGLALLPALLRVPALSWPDLPQAEDPLRQRIFGVARADAKHLAASRRRDVGAQGNPGQPHFLRRVEPAVAPAAHRALATRAPRGRRWPPLQPLRQHLRT